MTAHSIENVRYTVKVVAGFILMGIFSFVAVLPTANYVNNQMEIRETALIKKENRKRYLEAKRKPFSAFLEYEEFRIIKQLPTGLRILSKQRVHETAVYSWYDTPECYRDGEKLPIALNGEMITQAWENVKLTKGETRSVPWDYIGVIPKQADECRMCSVMTLVKKCACGFEPIEKSQKLCTEKYPVNQ